MSGYCVVLIVLSMQQEGVGTVNCDSWLLRMSWTVTNLDRRFSLRWLGSRCIRLRFIAPSPQSALHSGQAREHRDESLRSEGEAPLGARGSGLPLSQQSPMQPIYSASDQNSSSCLHASVPGRIVQNGKSM